MAYDAARGTFGYGRLRSTETYAEANNRRALKMDDPPLTREEVLTAAGLLALYALVPAYVWLALRLLA